MGDGSKICFIKGYDFGFVILEKQLQLFCLGNNSTTLDIKIGEAVKQSMGVENAFR